MQRDPLEGVYRVEGVHADPFDVVNKLKSTSSRSERKKLINQIKTEGLTKNKLILREVQKFEFDEGMSS